MNNYFVILAAGKSKRFHKKLPKQFYNYQNKEIVDHSIEKSLNSKLFKKILVVTNNPIRFKDSSKILTTKDFEEGLGPLGGILTAMKWIKDQKKDYEWISTFPSDTPFFTNKELKIFYENIDIKKSKLFFIKNKETRHNIFGLWSLDLLKKLETDLQKGERKVEVWADTVGVETINIEYEKRDPFFNINTKEDLEKAYKIMEND